MAFGQNPGALLVGTLSQEDKAFVASVLRAAKKAGYEKVVEPCSGGLAMSCIAADCGFEDIEASDITLFSGILGRYVEGRGIEDMDITRVDDGSKVTYPLDAMMEIKHAAKADVELVVPQEEFEPFVKALQATKKYGDVKNAGAAVWFMVRAALREFGEDDGRAYTPIMKLFGRAAIPETTARGVKALIDRKMKSGEISSPWETFENMMGDTYGKDGKAD